VILLDTNVVSEYRKASFGRADPRVVAWTEGQIAAQLYLSTITLHEVEKGVLRMERRDPKQGAVLRQWLDTALIPAFAGRILSVDERVAIAAAHLHIPDPRPLADSLIAATALVHGMTIATRNTSDFHGIPVSVINPWLA
jgi:toxin FitB